jgi:hypothetical protein
MMNQHPAPAHVFVGIDKIITLIDSETGKSRKWNFNRVNPAFRKELWDAIKNHSIKPIFWLLPPADEAREGYGSLHQIDPTPIQEYPRDLKDEQIMFLALNPDWKRDHPDWPMPQFGNFCLYCKEPFTPTNPRQRYCPGKDCRRKAELLRRGKKRGKSRSKKCENCGIVISGRADIRFCGDSCRMAYNRKKRGAGYQ